NPLSLRSSCLEPANYRYDSGRDEVVGWQKLKYTPLDIPLPASEIRLPDTHPALYPVIACAFLQGRLFAKLSLFRDQLIVRPEAALAGCRAPLHAVRDLVKAIQGRRAKNRKAIQAAWEEDKTFLLAEYIKLQRFADYERIRKLSDIWPPVDA
ncbi:helicase associated domain protein, partial [Cystoisospora suis]